MSARPSLVARLAIAASITAGASVAPASTTRAEGPTPDIEATDWPVDIRPIGSTTAARFERLGPTTGEHVDLLGIGEWHTAGIDGSGVTIGVIDFFDVSRYWDPNEHGPTPVAGITAVCFDAGLDCTHEFFDGVDAGGDDHGVAVVETIRDAAPGAELLIGQATTIDDYRRLVDWFIEHDVDIISRSLGNRYDGPGDGRGPLDEIVDHAVAHGVLWINSAGNNGRGKYYRHPVRLIGDRVAFGPTGSDTFLRFTGCVSLGGIRWVNDWDVPPAERTDYDAYLWESPTGDPAAGSIVDSSRNRQRFGDPPIENFPTRRCPAPGTSLYLQLRWGGGGISGDVIEILDYGSGIATFTTAAGSAAVSVVDSLNPGVVAVGAIDPSNGGEIAQYSSRGPSNDGRTLPDIAAPANFANTVQGRFVGTSAAAAAVAGAAALVIDAGLAADPTTTADLLRHFTIDRGATGPDTEYGHGEFRLPAPPTRVDDRPSRFVGLDTPTRVLDTRAGTSTGPTELTGRVERGDILTLPVTGLSGVPHEGVTAVAINLVAVDADRPSYLQAFPTDASRLGGASTVNIDAAGQTRANFAIVPVGADGSISIYSIAGGHVVADLLGWFEVAPGPVAAGRFVELDTAQRLLDTRRDVPVAPIRSGQILDIPMPARVDAGSIDALVVTVTVADPSAPGWVQAFPTDRAGAVGATSTVNTGPGGAVANTAIVPVSGGGMSVTAFFAGDGSSDVVVDAVGYITSSSVAADTAGRYVPVVPGRAYDSRRTADRLTDRSVVMVDASDAPGVNVPGSATAVVWNAAIVAADRPGFARSWSPRAAEPGTSTLNWSRAGEFRAGAVISAVADGRSWFRIDDGDADLPTRVGDLVVDVSGYFT
ncbi:MAG: S8 family serine peptidase [Ilumatobacteraceae bacterium]|nr:S8 family serine peptidase [Ilumatobacteraceae bacterium]